MKGICYIEKVYKNKIRWVGANEDPQIEDELKNLKSSYQSMCEEEDKLDEWIAQIQNELNSIANDEAQTKQAYLIFDDLKELNNFSSDENESFLIIKAPKGTSLEVPVKETNNSQSVHQLILSSNSEEIKTFLVSENKLLSETDGAFEENH